MSEFFSIRFKLLVMAFVIVIQLPAQVFAGNGGSRKFKDQNGGIEMMIPQPWQAIEHADADAIQIFLASGTGMFETGIIYNRIRDFKKVYPLIESRQVVGVWTEMLDNNCKSYFSCEILKSSKFNSGKFHGIKREITYTPFQGQGSMHAYQLVFYADNELIFITMQAPNDEWQLELPQFDSAISSLILK